MAHASTEIAAPEHARENGKRRRGLLLGALFLTLALIVVAAVAMLRNAPARVTLVQPQAATIRETITGTGTVYGVHETLVGSELSGTVQRLDVREGDRVRAGQTLAIVNDRVVLAQLAQARATVNTAQAQLLQTLKRAPESDIRAASDEVAQAAAQADQQRAVTEQAHRAQLQTRSQLDELRDQASLAAKQFDRTASLYRQGYTSRADFDNAQTQLSVANQRVAAQRRALESAQQNERAAAATLRAAQANVSAQHARLDTLLAGAQLEDINVSRSRVVEAQRALAAAQQQAETAVVRAPFDGTISAINAETGQTVGASGVARLVSSALEIHVDVDELNLGELSEGQTAAVSSNAFPGKQLSATVTRVGASVDEQRGTVTVTITPRQVPPWLRSGQTVNVEILTSAAIRRLLVPPSAVTRNGDRTIVYIVEGERAVERAVIVRPATKEGVPVLAGLSRYDRIIANAAGISPGTRVRAK